VARLPQLVGEGVETRRLTLRMVEQQHFGHCVSFARQWSIRMRSGGQYVATIGPPRCTPLRMNALSSSGFPSMLTYP
jgi:hypothetical protein